MGFFYCRKDTNALLHTDYNTLRFFTSKKDASYIFLINTDGKVGKPFVLRK